MARGIKKSTTQGSSATIQSASAKQPLLTKRKVTIKKTTTATTNKRGGVLTKAKGMTKGLKSKQKKVNNSANVDQKMKRDLRERTRVMKTERDAAIKDRKDAVRRERASSAAVRKELKEALKREQALVRLIDSRDQALRSFSEKWTKERIAQIQSPTKKRRRRRLNLSPDPVTQ
ncbi:MAG: hypothetical protein H0V34_00705 [Gammaproteobacteria bacterium]|nr:hypothetical protein [Gammaproteobacteria bacterium]